MAEDSTGGKSDNRHSTDGEGEVSKRKGSGVIFRFWNWLFRRDDFEKRLQYISKEEASVIARINRRSQRWQRMARQLIVFSVILEVLAVGYAVLTTRSSDLNWKMRAFRVLPMFLLPCLCSITYYTLSSFVKMRESKDQKTLEKLQFERRAKIDELKEKTKYYNTQQLIQRYDTDPAAKAAAATVLASKLGADSGLKVYVEDDPNLNVPQGRSKDSDIVDHTGLRRRKQTKSAGGGRSGSDEWQTSAKEMSAHEVLASANPGQPLVVEHYQPNNDLKQDGGWVARIAAMLVGENPMQSYALICGNCHRHNGLVSKEDFLYTTYYCPHCNALNMSKSVKDQPISTSHVPAGLSDRSPHGISSTTLEKQESSDLVNFASDMACVNEEMESR